MLQFSPTSYGGRSTCSATQENASLSLVLVFKLEQPRVYNQQGQKLFKKESDVGMLLTGIQSTETRCM